MVRCGWLRGRSRRPCSWPKPHANPPLALPRSPAASAILPSRSSRRHRCAAVLYICGSTMHSMHTHLQPRCLARAAHATMDVRSYAVLDLTEQLGFFARFHGYATWIIVQTLTRNCPRVRCTCSAPPGAENCCLNVAESAPWHIGAVATEGQPSHVGCDELLSPGLPQVGGRALQC